MGTSKNSDFFFRIAEISVPKIERGERQNVSADNLAENKEELDIRKTEKNQEKPINEPINIKYSDNNDNIKESLKENPAIIDEKIKRNFEHLHTVLGLASRHADSSTHSAISQGPSPCRRIQPG